jgi:hypothetical protein
MRQLNSRMVLVILLIVLSTYLFSMQGQASVPPEPSATALLDRHKWRTIPDLQFPRHGRIDSQSAVRSVTMDSEHKPPDAGRFPRQAPEVI